jgi:predicted RNA binding protein YcfA (HicA-like mRNA interferase family)
MKCSELWKILRRDGWEVHSQKGSHQKLKHPTKSGVIIFPAHGSKEMATGTCNSILKAAGLK